MSQLKILTYPNKLLKEKSKPIKEVTQSIHKLAQDMFEIMYTSHGIGLAAPQIGKLIQLIVIDIPLVDPIDPEKMNPDPMVLINPKIVEHKGTIEFEEGCLSCPELLVKVNRFERIKVEYLDLKGKPQQITLTDLKGICVQHEIDHLNGILLVDKISRLEREFYKKERMGMAKNPKIL